MGCEGRGGKEGGGEGREGEGEGREGEGREGEGRGESMCTYLTSLLVACTYDECKRKISPCGLATTDAPSLSLTHMNAGERNLHSKDSVARVGE